MIRRAKIGISLGDPGGVGPETAAKAVVAIDGVDADFTLFCSRRLFEFYSRRFRWAVELLMAEDARGNVRFSGFPEFDGPAPFGAPTPPGGEFAFRSFSLAVDIALDGEIDALVTAPLSKAGVELAGHSFSGHTEYLREASGVKMVVMLFAAGDLRAIPLTRHIALADVPGSIDRRLIEETVRIASGALGRFEGITEPRIAVLGLNPHAGEVGLFGDEEEIISEAIGVLRGEGYNIDGPLVPDIAFVPRFRERYDVIIGMYHDQVLIPFKMLYFNRGVNVTLGLPFIRTSPDHGTAYDIAGRDIADPTSMLEAIKLAIRWTGSTL